MYCFVCLDDLVCASMPLSISFEYLPLNVFDKLIINSDYNLILLIILFV